MAIELIIGGRKVFRPEFNFYKHKSGAFLIVIKNYNTQTRDNIEASIQEHELRNLSFNSHDAILKTDSFFYFFNLRDYEAYFPKKDFFIGITFEENGKIIASNLITTLVG